MISVYTVLAGIISYLIGNLNWAIIISRSKKQDIRNMGSGNPGTLNMSRNFGLKIGLLTFFLDILKGAIPTLIAFFAFNGYVIPDSKFILSDFVIYFCGLCAILGHIFPVIFKFKGGKGIASTIGVFLVCESVHGFGWASVCIMALVAAATFIYFTEFGAMGSFIAITPPAISSLIRMYFTYFSYNQDKISIILHSITNLIILLICFFTWFAHRQNIKRLLSGDEHPTSIKAMVVKLKLKKLSQQNPDKAKYPLISQLENIDTKNLDSTKLDTKKQNLENDLK